MNGRYVFWKNRRFIFTIILFLLFGFFSQSYAKDTTFQLSAVSDLDQVFEDGYHLPAMYNAVDVFGIRDEVISGQCVVHSQTDLNKVTAHVSGLALQSGGSSIPANAVEWNFVGSIPLSSNAPNQRESDLIRPAPVRYPDYLMAERTLDIKAGQYQAIWLTIRIPETATAGTYSGQITVRSSRETQTIPIYVTVYPFTMPDARHLQVTEWYTTNGFSRFHGIDQQYSKAWFAMLRTYAENMAAHRQNVFEVPMSAIGIRKSRNGNLTFDFSRFDQITQVFWDTEKMDYLETGFLTKFGEDGWSSTEILLQDFPVQDETTGSQVTLPGEKVIPSLLPAFQTHLKEKGWLDRTLFHVKDEPSTHNVMAYRKISEYLHSYAPDLTRMDAVETTFLSDDIEIAVPKLDHLGTRYQAYKKAAQAGTELWFYTVGIFQAGSYPNKTIDLPVIDNRVLHWLNYRFDLSGFLHWGWNQWTDDPFHEVGKHIGDGWMVYPARDGVLNSLRWEEMRNGIQDYEYLWLLEQKIRALKDSLGADFTWIDPSQRGKEIACRVVSGLAEHTTDPHVLYDARREILQEMLDFDTHPRVYVQTVPRVHSTIKSRSPVEVFGWTEPGTTITINGKEIPVRDDGLFMEIFSLFPQTNIINIQADKNGNTKDIVRTFEVEY